MKQPSPMIRSLSDRASASDGRRSVGMGHGSGTAVGSGVGPSDASGGAGGFPAGASDGVAVASGGSEASGGPLAAGGSSDDCRSVVATLPASAPDDGFAAAP